MPIALVQLLCTHICFQFVNGSSDQYTAEPGQPSVRLDFRWARRHRSTVLRIQHRSIPCHCCKESCLCCCQNCHPFAVSDPKTSNANTATSKTCARGDDLPFNHSLIPLVADGEVSPQRQQNGSDFTPEKIERNFHQSAHFVDSDSDDQIVFRQQDASDLISERTYQFQDGRFGGRGEPEWNSPVQLNEGLDAEVAVEPHRSTWDCAPEEGKINPSASWDTRDTAGERWSGTGGFACSVADSVKRSGSCRPDQHVWTGDEGNRSPAASVYFDSKHEKLSLIVVLLLWFPFCLQLSLTKQDLCKKTEKLLSTFVSCCRHCSPSPLPNKFLCLCVIRLRRERNVEEWVHGA